MIVALALAWADEPSSALAPMPSATREVRRIVLSNGEEYIVEVVATEAEGLRGRMPQGTRLFGFDDLVDLSPASEADYDSQPAWPVALTADAAILDVAQATLGLVPALAVAPVETLPPALRAQLDGCASSPDPLACRARAAGPSGFAADVVRRDRDLWIAVAASGGALREITVAGVFPTSADEADAQAAAARVLPVVAPLFGLDPAPPLPARAEALTAALAPFHAFRRPSTALRWVPVPGLAAFVEQRPVAGALALGGAIAGTTAWVAAVGGTASTSGEHAGLGAAGAVVLSVIANHLAVAPASPVTAVAAPIPGGASLLLGGRF